MVHGPWYGTIIRWEVSWEAPTMTLIDNTSTYDGVLNVVHDGGRRRKDVVCVTDHPSPVLSSRSISSAPK